jgi:hypothetical protein
VVCPCAGKHLVLLILKPGFSHLALQVEAFVRRALRGEPFRVEFDVGTPLRLSPEQVEAIWGHARVAMGQRWWAMAEYLISWDVLPMALRAPRGLLASAPREEFPDALRRLVGPTDPRRGGPDTLRGRYAQVPADSPDYYRNVLHAATDPAEVAANLAALRWAPFGMAGCDAAGGGGAGVGGAAGAEG